MLRLSNNEDILKYIENEKDIARYKISMLERKKNISKSHQRILEIEKEFVRLPLESFSFEDVADVAAAIKIYRTSRSLFYDTYQIKHSNDFINKEKLIDILLDKRDYLILVGKKFLTTKTQEINLVQNYDFFYDLSRRHSIKNGVSIELAKRELENLTLDDLLSLEPLTISKKRARTQVLIFGIGRYLVDEAIKIDIDKSHTIESLKEANERLDSIIFTIDSNIFKFFNDSIHVLPKKIAETMGKNSYIEKLHDLDDLFSETKYISELHPAYECEFFNGDKPILGNILYGQKKAITITPEKDSERNIQNKVFGVLLPVKRKGNEKMSLLYKKVIVDGLDISCMFSENLSNVRAIYNGKNIYVKALLMHPLWKLIDMAKSDSAVRIILSKLLKFKVDKFDEIDFSNASVIDRINQQYGNFLAISEKSSCLVPKTRSEEEGFSEVISIIDSKISEIKDDYREYINRANEVIY